MDDRQADPVSAGDFLRKSVSVVPFPDFPTAFTRSPRSEDARVAIVTTAGLMRHGEHPWTPDDVGLRSFGADERDLITGQVSMSLDRVGTFVDRNVFYPLERLQELADAGKVGSVAPRHISFMGCSRATSRSTSRRGGSVR
jgi:D-proline reductase (dithiol) PrdB